ncbi:MAG: hypothetical protein VX311_02030 [Planctomycetota bacterium]|nr:hypothetical protein [Planctomycetota bacterium]MEC9008601.1 hypothetical protein [Planctomycetota bacterium]MED5446604.1 hypothetical protein [Planctomycetota bacterium]MEE3283332.1 hypothetical protein [Planctomycetota bacterium]MEE3364990.1 hypothetical protein [Planctomycetota bacterium]
MSDSIWRVVWMGILGAGLIGMAGLLLVVGVGSVRELRQSLEELKPGDDLDEAESPVDPVE